MFSIFQTSHLTFRPISILTGYLAGCKDFMTRCSRVTFVQQKIIIPPEPKFIIIFLILLHFASILKLLLNSSPFFPDLPRLIPLGKLL
jgi:hypothetical protein